MEYIGKIYGKVAGKYFPLKDTSETIDKLRSERDELLTALKNVQAELPDNPKLPITNAIKEIVDPIINKCEAKK